MSSSSFIQVTSGLGFPRVTQGSTALDSTRRVTLVGWRLICGSDGETDLLRRVSQTPGSLGVRTACRCKSRTHLELQSAAALGRLSDAICSDAAVLSVIQLLNVRDDQHLSLFPGYVAGVVVPGTTVRHG